MMLAGVSVISIVLFIAVIVFAIMAVSFKDQLSAAIFRSSYQFNQEKMRN